VSTPGPQSLADPLSLAAAEARDAADPLRDWRDRFALPDGVIYLDGNSLGPLPRATVQQLDIAVRRQWGEGLVRSWNQADWIGAPARIGDKIARLIGAAPGSVIVADSVTVNLYKALTALLQVRPGTRRVLSEAGNFPTDVYVAEGAARRHGLTLDLHPRETLVEAIGDDVAVLVLTHVHFRSGARWDMAAIEAAAARHGVPVLWDLSHSVGAVPLDLGRDGARFAVGCGYKYLNGGPGAPGFVHVAPEAPWRDRLASPIQGWMGHADPFAFADGYRAAPGMAGFLAGTPPILSLLALEPGVDLMLAADQAQLFAKAEALFDWLAALMAARCPALRLITPRDAAARGSHASFAHADAWPICQALIAAGVIGDFRTPDLLRLGLTPLYLGFADLWHAVDRLAAILADESWRAPAFTAPARVT